jgi:hypothetical protein
LKEKSQRKAKFTAKDLGHFRVLREFRECLGRVVEEHGSHPSFKDSKRLLDIGDYLGLLLFGLLNPVARSLRGLNQASKIKKVQKDVCKRPASLGSLSEAQHLVDLEILEKVFEELSGQLCEAQERDTTKKPRKVEEWLAHDSSVWSALPRMSWALYGGGRNGSAKAVSLNLSFHVGADAPARASVTEARKCERAALREILTPGAAYVGDRYYGIDYGFFEELEKMGCYYCIRLRDNAKMEVIEELKVSKEEAAAGVLWQARVRLGLGTKSARSCELRVVHVRGVTGEILVLATNLTREELPGNEVALLYKNRWSIEYFFRWVKCVMGCGHWMAESENGVSIQIYLALIASLLLQLQLGRRPSQRVWELLQWHQSGCLEDDELEGLLADQLAKEERQRNKKPREPFWKKR